MVRIRDGLPLTDVAAAAKLIPNTAEPLVSGFGSLRYPKVVPSVLAESDRDLSLIVISGVSLGDEFDRDLVQADEMARRIPYQMCPASRIR
jgi:succinyl-CoA:acetate CoA-transferase